MIYEEKSTWAEFKNSPCTEQLALQTKKNSIQNFRDESSCTSYNSTLILK